MADKRADQLKEITERLEQGVKDIFTSEMYTKYLLTMSKFHNYSFNNTLLIAMQRPDATLVAGYNAWKNKFNRYVKKGEKGIQIIAPAPVKEREEREKIDKDTGLTVLNESGKPEIEVVERVIPRFRVTTVFDYAQTDGEPLPTLEVNELTARVKDYTLLKDAIEQVSPVPIRFGEIEGSAKGYYSHMDKEICVRADMGESQTIKTMIHEVAHAMLHDSDQMKQRGEKKDQLTKETEAESIAFTVCSALGIDTSDYSFPYVASWASGKELKELKDSMDTIRLTAADFLEKLETAVAERSVERMTAMEYAEKLIADKEQDKTIFDNNQRNLIVNFAYKLDDRAATEELANNLAAAIAAENTEEVNRLMWEAEEKIENLPDGMIGLSEMHEYGYLKDDVLPLTKEGAREWHRLGERIYPLFQDGTAGDFASQEEIEQHDGIFGIKADAWSAILLEKNEEYLEDEYARPDAALTVISREQALRLFDEGKQIYLIRISPWPVLVTGREEIERGSDYFQIAKEDLEKDKQKAMENSEIAPVEKLAAEKPTPEASISFYVAECAEFPVMGEFHDNLTLEQALEVYDKIPAERMNGIKSIGFSLEDGSIYSGMFDLMVGGEVQAEVVNHIQHYRESPLVQKAISDMKTLLEKRQASKELEERPNTRQSVREALKNRKKAQEQQSNQEQAKPKKAKKKGEMER